MRGMSRIVVSAGVALSLLLCVAARAQAAGTPIQVQSIEYLPTLGGSEAHATSISEVGYVTGWSVTAGGRTHAFLWRHGEGIRDITSALSQGSYGWSVNDLGDVVGWFWNDEFQRRPFVWTPERGMIELPSFGATQAAAYRINNAGQILGRLDVDDVIWEPDGSVTWLTRIFGGRLSSGAMNEFGEVTGYSEAGLFTWSGRMGFSFAGFPGWGYAINERGDVAGYGDLDRDGRWEPIFWSQAHTYELVPEEFRHQEQTVSDVNNLRQVLGSTEIPEEDRSSDSAITYIWSPGTGMVPLSPANLEDGIIGVGITDQGAVARTQETPGGTRAVVWQIVTPPQSIAAAMRVRITETARHDLLNQGPARALTAKLDQVDRALAKGGNASAHARALWRQIVSFSRNGVLPESQAIPLRQLARVLVADTARQ